MLLCSAVDPNFIDGAVVQLVSLAEVLSISGFDVSVLLRARIKDRAGRLTGDLLRIEGINVIEPDSGEVHKRTGLLSPTQMAKKVAAHIGRNKTDFVIARDLELNLALADQPALAGLLCSYLTNIPETVLELTPRLREQISQVADKSRVFFVQTEEGRSFLEAEFPEIAGKTALMSPMIPDSAFLPLEVRSWQTPGSKLPLTYSGKFKKEWLTLEMTDLPRRAAEHGVELDVTFMGDKFMIARDDETWMPRMQEAIEQAPGVNWIGAVGREESLKRVAQSAAGLSWRDISVDMSSQLSTKVLEYAAAGGAPLLRRTSTHESVFGRDYPLFIEEDDVMPTLLKMAEDRTLITRARNQAQESVREFCYSRRAASLKKVLERAFLPQQIFTQSTKKTRILLAGHDFKFLGELIDFWSRDPNIELIYDKWRYPNAPRDPFDEAGFQSADVIFCEWAANNAVWYSRNKLPHQKLIVRMHRFEMDGRWPPLINYENVDAFVAVGAHIVERMRTETSVRPETLHHIPNSIDCVELDRPKVSGAEFNIGLGGIVPIRKRPDRALAVLRELKRKDERYTLHIRGRLPSSYTDFNKDGFFRLYYQDIFRQFTEPGDLYGNVLHDRFGPDMANWYRRIGWILSPSTDESFHMTVAEGMASGTVPVLWDWVGADATYPKDSVFTDDPVAIADYIHNTVSTGAWSTRSDTARSYVDRYDISTVTAQWQQLLRSLFPEQN